MNYWRLKVKRQIGVEEVYDLRQQSSLFAGDDTENQICLHSVSIPSRLKIVQIRFGKAYFRLTRETFSSLNGKFEKKKSWKTRLYEGGIYEATGDVEWEIDGLRFKLEKVHSIPLSSKSAESNPLERKHFLQSVGSSVGSHLLLALLLVFFSALLQILSPSQEEIEVQQFSVAEIEQIFKPKPEPIIEPELETPPEDIPVEKLVPEKKTAQKAAAPKTLKKVAQAKSEVVQSAKGLPKKAEKKDVQSMGLLAMQNVRTSAERSVRLDKPRIVSPTATVADANGAGFSAVGEGIRSGAQTQSVAKLDGISSAGKYQSGEIGKQVQADSGPSIQLVRKEIEVQGGLDAAIVRQIIEERLAEVQYCYENSLLKQGDLSGKIDTSWTILADGSVSKMQSSSNEIKENQLHECVRGRIASWKFPNPKGGGVVHVKYPFVFRSLGG